MAEERIDVDGGKYTVILGDDGSSNALRYGEPWPAIRNGLNNLEIALARDLIEARSAPKITDEAVFVAMEAGHAEAHAWSSISRGGKVLVHDLKRVAQAVDGDLSRTLDRHIPLDQHVLDTNEEAVSYVSYRVYKAAIEAALNYQPENDHEADQPLRDHP